MARLAQHDLHNRRTLAPTCCATAWSATESHRPDMPRSKEASASDRWPGSNRRLRLIRDRARSLMTLCGWASISVVIAPNGDSGLVGRVSGSCTARPDWPADVMLQDADGGTDLGSMSVAIGGVCSHQLGQRFPSMVAITALRLNLVTEVTLTVNCGPADSSSGRGSESMTSCGGMRQQWSSSATHQ